MEANMSSLDRSLLLIKRLGEPPYELALAELASHIGIGKSGTFKILQTMRNHNFVVQDPSSKKYHLSPMMIRLGNVYNRFKGIDEISRPVLTNITRMLRETTYITVWEGDRAFPAYKNVLPGGLYDTDDFIGKSIPLNAGGSAMLLCAYQDPSHIRSLLDSLELEKRTPFTLTDKEKLMEEYARIRKQGYAVEDEIFNLDLVSLAVPVFDKEGLVWSSLALAAPKHHVPEERIPDWIQVLKNGAQELSYNFQFRR